MNIHTFAIAAEFGSIGLYVIGVLAFLVFALMSIGKSVRHFVITALVGFIWPIFIAVSLVREKKKALKNKV